MLLRMSSHNTITTLSHFKLLKSNLLTILYSNPRKESFNTAHVGRGGAANVFRPSQAEIEAAKKDNAKWESAISGDEKSDTARTPAPRGLAEKGKDWLEGLVAKKGSTV
jgi:hypothetical protein